jgi:hypothetical protein
MLLRNRKIPQHNAHGGCTRELLDIWLRLQPRPPQTHGWVWVPSPSRDYRCTDFGGAFRSGDANFTNFILFDIRCLACAVRLPDGCLGQPWRYITRQLASFRRRRLPCSCLQRDSKQFICPSVLWWRRLLLPGDLYRDLLQQLQPGNWISSNVLSAGTSLRYGHVSQLGPKHMLRPRLLHQRTVRTGTQRSAGWNLHVANASYFHHSIAVSHAVGLHEVSLLHRCSKDVSK